MLHGGVDVVQRVGASNGQPVTLTGTVTTTSPGAAGPLAGATVELWTTSAAGIRTRAAIAATSSTGTVTFTPAPLELTTYQLVYTGTADASGSSSAATPVTVTRATSATIALFPSVTWNTTTTLTGTLAWAGTTAGVAGRSLELWSSPDGQAWTKAQTVTTTSTGQAAFTVAVAGNSSYQLRYAGGEAGALTWLPAASAVGLQSAIRPTSGTVQAGAAARRRREHDPDGHVEMDRHEHRGCEGSVSLDLSYTPATLSGSSCGRCLAVARADGPE